MTIPNEARTSSEKGQHRGAHRPTSARRALERKLGYRFRNGSLLYTALVHRSFANESDVPVETNERLEFLGDAVLAFVVAEHLYELEPELDEGELTRVRASLVNRRSLAALARKLELGDAVVLGKGARSAGGQRLDSVLADTFEAVVGAVFLDGGIGECRALIHRLLGLDEDSTVLARLRQKDAKTRLQEEIQSRTKTTPQYVVLATPPDATEFRVRVDVNGTALASGTGPTKAAAEQAAAASALRILSPA